MQIKKYTKSKCCSLSRLWIFAVHIISNLNSAVDDNALFANVFIWRCYFLCQPDTTALLMQTLCCLLESPDSSLSSISCNWLVNSALLESSLRQKATMFAENFLHAIHRCIKAPARIARGLNRWLQMFILMHFQHHRAPI